MQPRLPRHHQPRRLACGQEPRVAAELPNLAKDALGRLQQRKAHVAADIEDAHLERRHRLRLGKEADDLVLVARIERPPMDRPARRLDLGDERRQPVAVAPPGEHDEPLARELLRDRGADVIAGTDDGDGGVALRHGGLLLTGDAIGHEQRAAVNGATRDEVVSAQGDHLHVSHKEIC